MRRISAVSTALLALAALNGAQAQQISTYVETQPFTEWYVQPLNATRYQPLAAGPLQFDEAQNRWTWVTPANMQVNMPLPNYFGSTTERGLQLQLTQSYCKANPTACCWYSGCSYWTGAHIESNSCFQYGTFTWEAFADFQSDNAVMFFFGIYVMAGSNMDTSTTWNEIDVLLANGPATGQFFGPAYFTPNEVKNTFSATTVPGFSQAFAQQWHNYTLVWTPTQLTWLIDGNVYWTVSNTPQALVPWRCASYRLILRTDGNLQTPGSDQFLYLRRFTYAPYSATGSHAEVESENLKPQQRAHLKKAQQTA